jgi:hypothetical protein
MMTHPYPLIHVLIVGIIVVLFWLFCAKRGTYIIPPFVLFVVKRPANYKPLLARGFLERKPITRRERVESAPPGDRKV